MKPQYLYPRVTLGFLVGIPLCFAYLSYKTNKAYSSRSEKLWTIPLNIYLAIIFGSLGPLITFQPLLSIVIGLYIYKKRNII